MDFDQLWTINPYGWVFILYCPRPSPVLYTLNDQRHGKGKHCCHSPRGGSHAAGWQTLWGCQPEKRNGVTFPGAYWVNHTAVVINSLRRGSGGSNRWIWIWTAATPEFLRQLQKRRASWRGIWRPYLLKHNSRGSTMRFLHTNGVNIPSSNQ